MAAIDFPASPTLNQIFQPPGGVGVSYMWNGTLWLAVGGVNAPSPGGDVVAVTVGPYSIPVVGTDTVVPFSSVLLGNTGGWWSTSTNRYTPPAGRYFMQASATLQTTASGNAGIALRKNGVKTSTSYTQSGGSAVTAPHTHGEMVDANGTDYFDWVLNVSSGTLWVGSWFSAFPLSGIKGPPGDPGQLGFRLLQRTDVSSAVATVDITGIPSDINDLKFHFDLTPATNDISLLLQLYDNAGALDNTTAHYGWALAQTYPSMGSGTAALGYGSTSTGLTNAVYLNVTVAGAQVGNAGGIRGDGTIPNIRSARYKGLNFQTVYLDPSGTLLRMISGSGWRSIATAITGIRLLFGGGSIASGAFSVWGSP